MRIANFERRLRRFEQQISRIPRAQVIRDYIDKDYEFCGIREKRRLGPPRKLLLIIYD